MALTLVRTRVRIKIKREDTYEQRARARLLGWDSELKREKESQVGSGQKIGRKLFLSGAQFFQRKGRPPCSVHRGVRVGGANLSLKVHTSIQDWSPVQKWRQSM